ncbi:MAG: DUF3341 domain-containing protein [Chloroflexota bacterium]|nr:MAG: DUF3341 domain-containing protein [Chloroflexota bacterium]
MVTSTTRQSVLGLFENADGAAEAVNRLQQAGFGVTDLDVLTGSPYPDGAFGEPPTRHRLYVFPFVGAACGLAIALLVTIGTQLGYPLVTGGKPILSIPPMINVCYEGTMLGAVMFTVLGILFESRLPGVGRIYDPRISSGYVGVAIGAAPARIGEVEGILRDAGAADIVRAGQAL